jgi:hypothetical protein
MKADKRESMKNLARIRISSLLPVFIVSVALTASAVSAGDNVWTTNGPAGRQWLGGSVGLTTSRYVPSHRPARRGATEVLS